MNRRQKADIERTIRETHSIHGRGEVIAIVWGIPYAGVDHSRQGMAVHQMQYGMGALNFVVTEDYKCVRYLHRDRLVIHIPRSRKTASDADQLFAGSDLDDFGNASTTPRMNRYLIFDRAEERWMHIGYDTKASASRAAKKMNAAGGDPSRYRVIDQR